MRRICFYAFFLLSTPGLAAHAAEDEDYYLFKKDPQGVVAAPAIEFIHKITGQRVLFVGMVHTGTYAYYQNVAKAIDHWSGDERTLLLKEFFVCEGSSYETLETSLTNRDIDSLKGIDLTPNKVFDYEEEQIQPLIQAFHLKKVACVVDLDGMTKRPRSLVERNISLCEAHHRRGGACQFADLTFPRKKNLILGNGDLQLDSQSPGKQFAAALFYRQFVIPDIEISKAITRIFNSLVVNGRNQSLVREIRSALDMGHRKLVVPWGAAHIFDLKERLEALGFEIANVIDIPMILPSDLGKGMDVDGIYNGDYVSDHYRF